jgi:alpha-mannosidase
VLERPEGGQRQEIYGPPGWDSPETVHLRWHPDWKAVREGPVRLLESRSTLHAGCAEFVQVLEMSTGDRLTNHYRVFPDEDNLELEVVLDKVALDDPHALYVCFPLEFASDARCHFETAGAVVELDHEQLPNTSKHYLTTQRFIRLQDASHGLTVACPDTPLWQVGGFTFGRHSSGEVERTEAMLLGWLTNNYWDTNFQADQSGQIRHCLRLIPHLAQALETSIQSALPYAVTPQIHWYKDRGPSQQLSAQLLQLELNGVMLTWLEQSENEVTLGLLNPTETTKNIVIQAGWLRFQAAQQLDLAGNPGSALTVSNGQLQLEIAARAWTGVQLQLSPQ